MHSARTISAEGCARMGQIALSPAFRALDTHDLHRGLRAHGTNRTLACISHTRHARSPQRVARQVSKTSVSYETSSKTHASKSAKRAFRTRLPPKVKRKHQNISKLVPKQRLPRRNQGVCGKEPLFLCNRVSKVFFFYKVALHDSYVFKWSFKACLRTAPPIK